MKVIGGYMELELPMGEEYHKNAIRLNTGRNSLEYILRANNFQKIVVPYYSCEAMLEPIRKLNLPLRFYNINEMLEPIFDFNTLSSSEAFLYINYFGIQDSTVSKILLQGNLPNIIIDNSQSFFSQHVQGTNAFYSPRKFFGVPDGGYLYSVKRYSYKYTRDVSVERMGPLLTRIDLGAIEGYPFYKNKENDLKNNDIKEMSSLTKRILKSIDYKSVATKRSANFKCLWESLHDFNLLNFDFSFNSSAIPMVYPFWNPNFKRIKKSLERKKIFTATYWPNVRESSPRDSIEFKLANEVLFLPIDQRYNLKDMEELINTIFNK